MTLSWWPTNYFIHCYVHPQLRYMHLPPILLSPWPSPAYSHLPLCFASVNISPFCFVPILSLPLILGCQHTSRIVHYSLPSPNHPDQARMNLSWVLLPQASTSHCSGEGTWMALCQSYHLARYRHSTITWTQWTLNPIHNWGVVQGNHYILVHNGNQTCRRTDSEQIHSRINQQLIAGHFGHEGLCQLHTKLKDIQSVRPTYIAKVFV